MKIGVRTGGYTIIEVLIFLAVSGALMVSALTVFGGQQQRTEFSQAVREFDSQMRDIINDVSTGYYPDTQNIICKNDSIVGQGIKLTSGSTADQGTNSDCIFVGRVIQFRPEGLSSSSMRVYTVAGQRQFLPRQDARTLIEAKPKLVAPASVSDTDTPHSYEDIANNPAIAIGKICYKSCNASEEIMGGIGIFTTFGNYVGNSLQTSVISAELAPIVNSPPGSSTLGQSLTDFVSSTNNKLSGTKAGAWAEGSYRGFVEDAAASGIRICLLSLGTQQHAIVKIGGDSRQLTTELTFHNGNQESDC